MSNVIVGNNLIAAITGGVFYTTALAITDYETDSPASILASYITGQGIMSSPNTSSDWPLYVSHRPDEPGDIGTIYDTSGIKDGRDMRTGAIEQHYGLQIVIRSESYEGGWNKINVLLSNLDSIFNTNVVKDDTTYTIHNVSRIGTINPLGYEKNTKRRHLFGANLLASITQL